MAMKCEPLNLAVTMRRRPEESNDHETRLHEQIATQALKAIETIRGNDELATSMGYVHGVRPWGAGPEMSMRISSSLLSVSVVVDVCTCMCVKRQDHLSPREKQQASRATPEGLVCQLPAPRGPCAHL